MNVKKNFMYNILYQVLLMIMPLITTPYIARVIGPEGIGMQSYTYSLANYFVLFAMLGINNHGNRSIAIARGDKENLSKTFFSIYSIQFIMSILMIIFYSIYVLLFENKYRLMYMIQVIYIISALFDINWFFFGMEKFKITVVRNTIIKLISVISIFVFVKESKDIYIYSLILSVGVLLGQLILWKYIKDEIEFIKIEFKDIKEHFKSVLYLFIPILAISVYKIMDKIMIGLLSSITQVGFYENSEKIINIPMGIIIALGTVMLPRMSNLYSKGSIEETDKYISLSIEFSIFIAIGSMFGLMGSGSVIIPVFLGEQFYDCIGIVSLLSITILFVSWANVIRTQYLIPNKKDKQYITSTIIGAIVNLVSNICLIGKYGAIGATIGTILAEITVATYQTFIVRNDLSIRKYIQSNLFYFIPGVIMCVAVRYIGDKLGISLSTAFIQVILGIIIYTSISFVYSINNKRELLSSINFRVKKIISKRYI